MSTERVSLLDYTAAIFDVDGTLVDSVDFHAEAWRRAFAEFGIDLEFDEIRAQIGKGGDQLMPVFLSKEELEEKGEEIEAVRTSIFKRDYIESILGFPQVRELFEALIDRGVTVALGSSAKGDELQIYKKAAGIDDLDLVQLTSDDAEKSKPHTDIFEAALDRLGMLADKVIVVGDSPYDMEAAGRAGIAAVGVLCGGFDESALFKAGALHLFRDPVHILDCLTQPH